MKNDAVFRNLKKISPTILSCISAVGVVATSAMTVKATTKALRIVDENTNYNCEPSKTEAIQLTWKCYIPATAIGLSTIACIFGANVLNKRNQASIISAYVMLNESYQQYKKSANAVYGEDADSKIKIQMAKDTYVSADGYSVYSADFDPESEKILCYDLFSQRYFTATMAAILNAQYHINRNLCLRGDATINEFYDFLGLPHIDGGDNIGWSIEDLMEDGIIWLDFDNRLTKMDDGMECCVISTPWNAYTL